MKNPTHGHVVGMPVSSISYAAAQELHEAPVASVPDKKDRVQSWMHKLRRKANSYVQGIRESVALAPKMSKAMKGRITQSGGTERFFNQAFSVGEEERLLNAYPCYLSTTAGPIAGLLFISTRKIAFQCDKWLKLASPDGQSIRVQGFDSTEKDKVCNSKQEFRQAESEIYPDSYRGQVRVLVYGFH